jgi:hypothetical protein
MATLSNLGFLATAAMASHTPGTRFSSGRPSGRNGLALEVNEVSTPFSRAHSRSSFKHKRYPPFQIMRLLWRFLLS